MKKNNHILILMTVVMKMMIAMMIIMININQNVISKVDLEEKLDAEAILKHGKRNYQEYRI